MKIRNEIYKFLADYIIKHTGIVYTEQDYYRLDMRIGNLIENFKFGNPDELYKFLQKGIEKSTHDLLINIFTNNETYFMRDLKPFKVIPKGILDNIKKDITQMGGIGNINVWSCACSSGQEVYSIQMAVDTFGNSEDLKKMQFDASDISETVLAKAKTGIYSSLEVQRGLPAPLLIKYFTKKPIEGTTDEVWVLNKDFVDRTTFFKFNLLTDNYPVNKYHLIFCRNVLIYQNIENKQKILTNLVAALKPNGYFMMGAGESLVGLNVKLKHIEIDGVWLYQKI